VEINLSTRKLPWIFDGEILQFVCQHGQNRGTVLIQNVIYWKGCIEQPGMFKRWSPEFRDAEKALDWTEEELLKTGAGSENNKENPSGNVKIHPSRRAYVQIMENVITPEVRARLEPFWIAVTSVEQKQKSFKVYIELKHQPLSYKTLEKSFGEEFRYDAKYPTPTELGKDLGLPPSQFEIINLPDGSYLIESYTVYYQDYVAAAQAQQAWDNSRIVDKFSQGKVLRARYGFREVETHFDTFLGACENPDLTFDEVESREEFIAKFALRETLIYALEVSLYRDAFFGGPSNNRFNDSDILELLHNWRARSAFIPAEARQESNQWLIDQRNSKSLNNSKG